MNEATYSDERAKQDILTYKAQETLVANAFRAKAACSAAGAITMDALMRAMPAVTDLWQQLAVVDRLRELGYLREVQQIERVPGQCRIFHWTGPGPDRDPGVDPARRSTVTNS